MHSPRRTPISRNVHRAMGESVTVASPQSAKVSHVQRLWPSRHRQQAPGRTRLPSVAQNAHPSMSTTLPLPKKRTERPTVQSASSSLVNSQTHQTAVSRLRRCSTPQDARHGPLKTVLANRRIGPYMTHRNSRRGRAINSHVPAYRLMPQPLLHGLVSLCRLTALRCSCSELLQAGYRRSAAPRTPRRWPADARPSPQPSPTQCP